jgi:hypothetical protein
MSITKSISNLVVAVIVVGGAYTFLNRESSQPGGGDLAEYAKRSCVDEIVSRYDTQSANAYRVDKNSKGFVVRASMTLTRGTPVKVICLANENGRVEEITIDER